MPRGERGLVWSVNASRLLHEKHVCSQEHERKAIEERTSERNMNVTLRRTLMVCVLALILAAMMVAMSMPAFAAPRVPQGTCDVGGLSAGNGAFGCAGNVGGSIVTEQQGCKDINRGPFNDNEFAC
jgi:hypothetical protein